MSSPALELASTIQTASINRSPSPRHDLNPSTTASRKQPVTVSDSEKSSTSIPSSAVKPAPRRKALPPLPDLRFEQSYLASLQGAESWARVAWITVRDQVRMPALSFPLLLSLYLDSNSSIIHYVTFTLHICSFYTTTPAAITEKIYPHGKY